MNIDKPTDHLGGNITKSAIAVPYHNDKSNNDNDDKYYDIRYPYWFRRGTGEHGEDRRITVVKADTIDDTIVGQVILDEEYNNNTSKINISLPCKEHSYHAKQPHQKENDPGWQRKDIPGIY